MSGERGQASIYPSADDEASTPSPNPTAQKAEGEMILVFATESMTADDMVIALAVVLSLAILVALSLSAVRKYAGRFRHR